MSDDEKFEAIEHQIWHLVEDVRELSNEVNVLCRLFVHIHRKDIPDAWMKMYKLNDINKKLEHETIEDFDKNCIIEGIKDVLKRFGRLKDEDE